MQRMPPTAVKPLTAFVTLISGECRAGVTPHTVCSRQLHGSDSTACISVMLEERTVLVSSVQCQVLPQPAACRDVSMQQSLCLAADASAQTGSQAHLVAADTGQAELGHEAAEGCRGGHCCQCQESTRACSAWSSLSQCVSQCKAETSQQQGCKMAQGLGSKT